MNSLGDVSQGHATATAGQVSASTPLVMAASVEEEVAIIRRRLAFLDSGRPSSSTTTHVKHTAPSQSARALDRGKGPMHVDTPVPRARGCHHAFGAARSGRFAPRTSPIAEEMDDHTSEDIAYVHATMGNRNRRARRPHGAPPRRRAVSSDDADPFETTDASDEDLDSGVRTMVHFMKYMMMRWVAITSQSRRPGIVLAAPLLHLAATMASTVGAHIGF